MWPPVVSFSYKYFTKQCFSSCSSKSNQNTNKWMENSRYSLQTIAFFPNLLCFLMKNYWGCFQYCFVLSFCFRKEANISPPVSTSKERTHLRLENLQSNCPSIPSTTISGKWYSFFQYISPCLKSSHSTLTLCVYVICFVLFENYWVWLYLLTDCKCHWDWIWYRQTDKIHLHTQLCIWYKN